jgi:hypothetical protein
MAKHAKYSASKINRLIRCPGSEDFIQYLIQKSKIPADETTTEADEGTMLHKEMENYIQGEPITDQLDAEQKGCIEDCYAWLLELQDKHNITWVQTERQVDLKGYGIEDSGGTADVIGGSGKRTIHIVDWKFGKGVPVYVNKNEQLMTYLLGAAENIEALQKYKELWIHLAQPRFDYYSSYQCPTEELIGLLNAIKNAIKSYDIIAGEIQCFWCRGKTRCAEYEEYIRNHAAVVFKTNDIMKKNEISFKQMSKALAMEPLFKKFFKAIKDEFQRLNSDQLAELNLKRVAGRSTRSYISEEQVVNYLCENYGDIEDIYETPSLKSPAQMEKAVKGLKKDPEFQKLIIKPLGKPTIVSADDPRPDYTDGISASSVFSHLVDRD